MNEDKEHEAQSGQDLKPLGNDATGSAAPQGRKMKDCFGISMGWFMEDLIGDLKDLEKCYTCVDFDPCYKLSMIRVLTSLRYEVRKAARTVGLAVGGSHSAYPYG